MKDIKFKKPESLVIPEGVSTSGEFEALATLKLEDGGNLCLVAIDGNRLESGEDEKGESEKEDKRSYAEAASSGMEGGMMEGMS